MRGGDQICLARSTQMEREGFGSVTEGQTEMLDGVKLPLSGWRRKGSALLQEAKDKLFSTCAEDKVFNGVKKEMREHWIVL